MMKFIATDVTDSKDKMKAMVAEQLKKKGFAINPYFYRSHVTYQAELENILFKSWLYAGHISQIPNNGDYFLFELAEDSIIISRDQNGEVQALMNICRHRGARVCEEHSGNRKTFVCPYHGWVFNTDGSLKMARAMEMKEGFDPKDYGLKKARLEIFEGLIFVNTDPNAADFKAPLEKLRVPLSAYDLPNAKIAHSHTYKIDANWKLAIENYQECYHCATSHRQYAKLHSLKDLEEKSAPINEAMHARSEAMTGLPGLTVDFYEACNYANGFGADVYHSRYALYDDFKTGSRDGQPVAPLMGSFKGYDGGAGDFQMGPLCFMLNYPDHCVLYRFTPRGLTQTDLEVVWFVKGDAVEGKDYDKDEVTYLWHHTTLEDEYIITRNSEGVNSHFFEPGPYHPEFEEPCIEFIDWYLTTLHQSA
ncbi:aromatic ring-hydroxylating dioxygenase subunit alpha [Dasania sp. GY-MA-18]|uniref:Aromatic ring-hydroxylating dioxygenase subunit alpha n=1 Tax=Dasania phycosphaerae TaxID=2950436 RepID=A0A9J6RMR2_9GAMM|nr:MULTISPECIES: aromatic ring-hydroxylating dioxygenase subunit alpha [Dasania]MCR8923177.1 aromatic ring-hydroxylating dioxygenase subunit alpha [Dasania sp. GY-MA-18]MCZ0865609.1 aromatic ring-hydroxylating dioxygenase subunit alpha [Dasania phycosphaerae]MCZ0869334.1 aromatic ring-hydroxylating dioxygenase subunit alpha [Dasania phycosphaerae]